MLDKLYTRLGRLKSSKKFMPRVSGIFDELHDIDQIEGADVAKWLKTPTQLISLQNFLANRILYPQAIPVSVADIEIDLSILREALKLEKSFFSALERQIIIPESFMSRIPDLIKLVWVFIDVYLVGQERDQDSPNVWTVILRTEDSDEVLGSVITPYFQKGQIMQIILDNKTTVIKQGSLVVVPCQKDKCDVRFRVYQGKMLNQAEGTMEVMGGKLGLVFDGRST